MSKTNYSVAFCALLVLAVSACDQNTGEERETRQSAFPGQVSAGGGTGGEVMAKNGTLQAKKDPMSSPVEVKAGAPGGENSEASAAGSGADKQAGTPGIPGGSEGNVGGTAMGGTTPDAAKTEDQPQPKPAANDPAAKEAEAKAKAEKEKQQLEASMDAVSQRWRALADARGWQSEAAADSGSSGASTMQQTQTSAIGLPSVIRSEKLGTAPPSEDVKDPAKEPTN